MGQDADAFTGRQVSQGDIEGGLQVPHRVEQQEAGQRLVHIRTEEQAHLGGIAGDLVSLVRADTKALSAESTAGLRA